MLQSNGFEIIYKDNNTLNSLNELADYLKIFNDIDLIVNFFDILEKLIENTDLEEQDKRIGFTLRKNVKQISINFGKKHVLCLFRIKNKNFLKLYIPDEDAEWARKQSGYKDQEVFDTQPPAMLFHFEAVPSVFNNILLFQKVKKGVDEWLPFVVSAGQEDKHNYLLFRLAVDHQYRDNFILNFLFKDIIPEIVIAIQSDFIQKAINEVDFRFQKATDSFKSFKDLKEPSLGFFKNIQEKYLQSESTYTDFIKTLDRNSEEYRYIYAIGKLISYIDINAADKNNLNEYDDKRTLARTGVRQTLWLKSLLEYKVNKHDYSGFTSIIKSALTYLEDPTKEITLFSENHREMVAINLLKQPSFDKDEFVNQFVAFFKPYGIKPENPLNYNRIISEILYLFPDVEKLWKKDNEIVKQSINSVCTDFYSATKNSGLIFSEQLIKRFIASLCTKPFVICSGLSGSGKTKLAQAFAQWISYKEADGEKNEQYCIVPVGADWTNREPLLGYPNALQDAKYVKPENGVLDLINRARLNETKPYFLILDEMNLSHVERYFADFLSTMESGDAIPLHTIDNEEIDIPKQLNLPKNLFIIGTVNIDETTYMFSPKVLDRANTIEFRLTEADLDAFIDSDITLDMNLLKGEGVSMGKSFVVMATKKTDKNLKKAEVDLKAFFKELKKTGAEFGYRTASEIGRLMFMLELFGEKDDNLLDIAIMQKLLPKLHGSRNKLTKVLPVLGSFCLKNNEQIKEKYLDKFVSNSITEEELNKDKNIKYRISFEKICRMYKNAVENGFANYAEA
jgi:DNA polymerase III delta prime subunit